jgi:hypothetical protein
LALVAGGAPNGLALGAAGGAPKGLALGAAGGAPKGLALGAAGAPKGLALGGAAGAAPKGLPAGRASTATFFTTRWWPHLGHCARTPRSLMSPSSMVKAALHWSQSIRMGRNLAGC